MAEISMSTPEPYRPSNGTEGEAFAGKWCHQCARYGDVEGPVAPCEIEGRALMNSLGDPEYPKEWLWDAIHGARCTAFTTEAPTDEGRVDDPRQPALF